MKKLTLVIILLALVLTSVVIFMCKTEEPSEAAASTYEFGIFGVPKYLVLEDYDEHIWQVLTKSESSLIKLGDYDYANRYQKYRVKGVLNKEFHDRVKLFENILVKEKALITGEKPLEIIPVE